MQPRRRPLLTVPEYAALPEDGDGVTHELVEGNLVMSPRPIGVHQLCIQELLYQLRGQVPALLVAVNEVDVDLGLVPPTQPGFVRVPNVVVVPKEALHRQRREGGLFHASEVTLAVEVISPGSWRLDTVVKRDEYADVGIPHYWVVDLGEPGDRITLTAHHLAGEFGYADPGAVTGYLHRRGAVCRSNRPRRTGLMRRIGRLLEPREVAANRRCHVPHSVP